MKKRLFNQSFIFLVLGLVLGVFYREYSKILHFNGKTALSVLHTHTLILGFLFFLLVLLLEDRFKLSGINRFNLWNAVYLIGLCGLIGTLCWRGILDCNGADFKGLNHIAGLFHTILGGSLIWFMLILKKAIKDEMQ